MNKALAWIIFIILIFVSWLWLSETINFLLSSTLGCFGYEPCFAPHLDLGPLIILLIGGVVLFFCVKLGVKNIRKTKTSTKNG